MDNNKKESGENSIEILLPRVNEKEDDPYVSKGTGKLMSMFSASMDEMTKWFKNYQIEFIELNINGVVESGSVTKLLVSAKGEGGLKVVLKPKY